MNAGMTPMEIRRLYPKSDDPIFYSLYSEQYKGIKHEFAIVWGQFGTSPYEAEAIKRIEAATAQVFAGQQN